MDRVDLITRGVDVVIRMIVAARSLRDAESIVHQLEAMGPAARADLDAVKNRRLAELREDVELGTVGSD